MDCKTCSGNSHIACAGCGALTCAMDDRAWSDDSFCRKCGRNGSRVTDMVVTVSFKVRVNPAKYNAEYGAAWTRAEIRADLAAMASDAFANATRHLPLEIVD